MTELGFNSICRLCIQIFDKEKVSPIFNNRNYSENISLPERIKYCSSVEVAENDGLPPQICDTCLLKLNQSFVFRNQCVFADITLKRLKDFSLVLNKLPQLPNADFENQIIKSDENLCKISYSLKKSQNKMRAEDKIDEFDNSKNGRHRRNIHKLKRIFFQETKTQNKNHKEESLLSGEAESNFFPLKENLNFKNKKGKFLKKKLKKKITSNIDSKIKKPRKLNKMKEFLQTKGEEQKSVDEFQKNNSNHVKEWEKSDNVLPKSKVRKIGKDCKSVTSNKTKQMQKKRKNTLSKEKPSSYKCDHCLKVYPSEGGLRYHIHTMHDENYQPFICDLCGKSFKVKKNLEAHKNAIHFHLKHQLCDLCGRRFASKYSLKVHKSWHNDEKNFTCDICGIKFRTRGKLNTHLTVHGGTKKFMCHICSKDFRWKKDFEIHMRTHTGEKPFKCSNCVKAFASLTNMRKHEKKHFKKVDVGKMPEKLNPITSEEKPVRNEFLDFGFGSEDVKSQQINQVSGTTLCLNLP